MPPPVYVPSCPHSSSLRFHHPRPSPPRTRKTTDLPFDDRGLPRPEDHKGLDVPTNPRPRPRPRSLLGVRAPLASKAGPTTPRVLFSQATPATLQEGPNTPRPNRIWLPSPRFGALSPPPFPARRPRWTASTLGSPLVHCAHPRRPLSTRLYPPPPSLPQPPVCGRSNTTISYAWRGLHLPESLTSQLSDSRPARPS
jgi:hypothetical protein